MDRTRKMLWTQQESLRAGVAMQLKLSMVDYIHGEADFGCGYLFDRRGRGEARDLESTILRWLKKGYDEKVRRDRNGWRVFTAADVKAIKKDMGL